MPKAIKLEYKCRRCCFIHTETYVPEEYYKLGLTLPNETIEKKKENLFRQGILDLGTAPMIRLLSCNENSFGICDLVGGSIVNILSPEEEKMIDDFHLEHPEAVEKE